MKDYVVLKTAFTSSNSAWVEKLTPTDQIFMYTTAKKAKDKVIELIAAETGSMPRNYKWEYIPGFEKKKEKKD